MYKPNGFGKGVSNSVFCAMSTSSFFQSVVGCLWHEKLNQIVVGCGNGTVKVFFDPERSNKYVMNYGFFSSSGSCYK